MNKPIVIALGAAIVLGLAYVLLRPQGATSSLINTGNPARPGGVNGVPTNAAAAGVQAGTGIINALSNFFKGSGPTNNIKVDPTSVSVDPMSPAYNSGLDVIWGTIPSSEGGTGPVIGLSPADVGTPVLTPPGLPSDTGATLQPGGPIVADNPGFVGDPTFDPTDPSTWVLGAPSPVYSFGNGGV